MLLLEIEVNLNRLAFTRALNNNSNYIELLEKQYDIGSEKERMETFQNLGLREEE